MDLEALRDEIDAVDRKIIALFGRRFEIVDRVAAHKAANAIPMMQPGRVESVKARARTLALEHGVDPGFAERLYTLVIDETCTYEDGRMAAASVAHQGG